MIKVPESLDDQKAEAQLMLISGLSGSGKTIALHALEDLKYYAVDNLPASLLPQFIDSIIEFPERYGRVAVAIDARNRDEALPGLPQALENARKRGLGVSLVYLTADERSLIKRFSETRRRHPLTNTTLALPEAIRHEARLLSPLEQEADHVLDTTDSTLHELRSRIWKLVRRPEDTPLTLVLESFAFKRGVPRDVDYIFDVRCLPNPYWEPDLREQSGLAKPVADWLKASDLVQKMLNDIERFVIDWLPHFQAGQRSYLTVGIGCTGGKHRSVFLVDQLNRRLSTQHDSVVVHHREIN